MYRHGEPRTSGPRRSMWGALRSAAIAIVLSALLYAYSLIMGTSDAMLPWALKTLMISLVTLAVFIYRKPFTGPFSAVGIPSSAPGTGLTPSLAGRGGTTARNTVDAATVAVPGFAAHRTPAGRGATRPRRPGSPSSSRPRGCWHGITKEWPPFVYGWHRPSVAAPTRDCASAGRRRWSSTTATSASTWSTPPATSSACCAIAAWRAGAPVVLCAAPAAVHDRRRRANRYRRVGDMPAGGTSGTRA